MSKFQLVLSVHSSPSVASYSDFNTHWLAVLLMHLPTQQPLSHSASSSQGDPLGSSEGDDEGDDEGNTLGDADGTELEDCRRNSRRRMPAGKQEGGDSGRLSASSWRYVCAWSVFRFNIDSKSYGMELWAGRESRLCVAIGSSIPVRPKDRPLIAVLASCAHHTPAEKRRRRENRNETSKAQN